MYGPAGKRYLTIPRYDDDNHIADAWEEGRNAGKQFADWDEDPTPAIGAHPGDGMSSFDECRGYIVLDGKKQVFRRMDPQIREMFVIDDSGIFAVALWRQATGGIVACRLSGSLVRGGRGRTVSRVVDFNAGSRKLASRLQLIKTKADPDHDPGCEEKYLGCAVNASSPKGADFQRCSRYVLLKVCTVPNVGWTTP